MDSARIAGAALGIAAAGWIALWGWGAQTLFAKWREGRLSARRTLGLSALMTGIASGTAFLGLVAVVPGPRDAQGALWIALLIVPVGAIGMISYTLSVMDRIHWDGKMLRELRQGKTGAENTRSSA